MVSRPTLALPLAAALGASLLGQPVAQARGKGKAGVVPVDACATSKCRELTRPEAAMMGRVLSKLMALLPSPDSARYEQRGLKSAQGPGGIMIKDAMWQAADFPANVVDTMALGFGKAGAFPRTFALVYSYTLKDEAERAQLGMVTAEHKLDSGDVEYFDRRIEASAWAIPAPLEPGMVALAGGDTWEKKLAGEEKGTSRLTVVVGPSGRKTALPLGEPSDKLAPVKAVRVTFQGPTAEVRALASRLDRSALKGLIGPIEKIVGMDN
ncbi:MAG: hypothetical protein HY901_09070 [Deltaproteobacteria bacterium]|nr:hypothetical protein [Deltaproteobacteria bacterium]